MISFRADRAQADMVYYLKIGRVSTALAHVVIFPLFLVQFEISCQENECYRTITSIPIQIGQRS